jgi:hypothetical protein
MRPIQLGPISTSEEKFEEEKNAFMQLRAKMLSEPKYANKHVAIVDGKIAGVDSNEGELARRTYGVYGYRPIYIGKIEHNEEEEEQVQSPSVMFT